MRTEGLAATALVVPLIAGTLWVGWYRHAALPGAGEEPERREVTPGDSDGENIEIVEGLSEGDVVMLPERSGGGWSRNPAAPCGSSANPAIRSTTRPVAS